MKGKLSVFLIPILCLTIASCTKEVSTQSKSITTELQISTVPIKTPDKTIEELPSKAYDNTSTASVENTNSMLQPSPAPSKTPNVQLEEKNVFKYQEMELLALLPWQS